MEKKIKEYSVVEYSRSQGCFHLESVGEMLIDGLAMMHGRRYTDYYPIGIFKEEFEAREFLDDIYVFMKTKAGKHIGRNEMY